MRIVCLGGEEGCQFISNDEYYLNAIIELARDPSQPDIMRDALLALVNLSTDPEIARKIISLDSQSDYILHLLKSVLQPDFDYARIATSILCNLSRHENCAGFVVKSILENKDDVGFDKIITAFCTIGYNKNSSLDYLGSFLSNLTQLRETRQYILDKERCVVQRLLPFTEYEGSLMRRGGVVATLHNCCFETGVSTLNFSNVRKLYLINGI